MAKGGKRPGAGRKVGSTTRPQFCDYFTEDDIRQLVEVVKEQAVQDNKLLMWCLDHRFGKAAQTVDIPPIDVTIGISHELITQVNAAIDAYLTPHDNQGNSKRKK